MTHPPQPFTIGVNSLFLIPGQVGGSETYLRETLRALRVLPGVSLHLFTNEENHQLLAAELGPYDNVKLTRLPCRARRRPERILREQWQLPQLVAATPLDVLWNPGYTAPTRCSVPMVTSILDMQYKHFPEDLSWPARVATNILVNRAVTSSRHLLTLSDFSRRDILHYTHANEADIHVTHLAASLEFSQQQPCRAGEPAIGSPYLLCVANSYPHKNLPALVEAFGLIAPEHAHRLVLAGHPRRGEAELQKSLQALPSPIRRRVVRVADLDRTELIALYRNAELFLFPSLYEGFGLPVLEAMRVGTRIVATACAAIPEVCGGNAILAEKPEAPQLADAIRSGLAESEELRRKAIANAKEWASSFTWERTARETLAVLRMAARNTD